MAIRLSRFTSGMRLPYGMTLSLESGVDIERRLSIILGRRFEYADPPPRELSPWLGWLRMLDATEEYSDDMEERIEHYLEGEIGYDSDSYADYG